MRTHVALVLDRSGSMGSCWQEAMDGLDAQLDTVRQTRTPDHEVLVSFTRFDDVVDILALNEPVDSVKIDREGPRNQTALYDAIGQTIETIIEAPPLDVDDAYLLCIISDGQENASRQFDLAEIKQMLTLLQSTGLWTVAYLGANSGSAQEIADLFGIPVGNVHEFEATQAGMVRGMAVQSVGQEHYMRMRSLGASSVGDYYATRGRPLTSPPAQAAPPPEPPRRGISDAVTGYVRKQSAGSHKRRQ